MMRILTLVDDAHIRSVLHAALLPHYDLIPSLNTQAQDDAAMLDQPFDLAIVDEAALERGWRHIAARREVEGAVYLPLLFLTPRASVAMTVSHWREHIDDFLVTPFDNIELAVHVESLLRTRRH